eukprot:COSAG05_NODE_1926_length_3825_cov_1.854804_3_plen_244_part_00
MTTRLQTALSNITATVVASQTDSVTSIKAAAKTAVHAFNFGGVAEASTGWTQVNLSSSYTTNSGFGWLSNTSDIQLIKPSTTSTYDPLEDSIGGGIAGASFGVDLVAGEYTVSVLVGCHDCNLKVAITGVRDGATAEGSASPNRGLAGERVRSGIYQLRTMPYVVGAKTSRLVLNFTGQAVGPQLSIDNMALATEGAFYSKVGWLVNAVLIHERSASSTLPDHAQRVLAQSRDRKDPCNAQWH